MAITRPDKDEFVYRAAAKVLSSRFDNSRRLLFERQSRERTLWPSLAFIEGLKTLYPHHLGGLARKPSQIVRVKATTNRKNSSRSAILHREREKEKALHPLVRWGVIFFNAEVKRWGVAWEEPAPIRTGLPIAPL